MIDLNDIKYGVWITKKEDYIIGLYVDLKSIRQVLYNENNNKSKIIVYKNEELLQSDLKTKINDLSQQESFISRCNNILKSKPYWSIVGESSDIDNKIISENTQHAVNESIQERLVKFSKLISDTDKFIKNIFYKDNNWCETIASDFIASIQFKADVNNQSSKQPVEVSMDQFQTATNMSSASIKIDQSTGKTKTYDFSKVRQYILDLIKDVGEGKPVVKITSNNKQLNYKYIQVVNSEKLIFTQIKQSNKNVFEINFDEGTINVNNIPSKNVQDKNRLRDLIKQSANDLEKNKASVEGVDKMDVRS